MVVPFNAVIHPRRSVQNFAEAGWQHDPDLGYRGRAGTISGRIGPRTLVHSVREQFRRCYGGGGTVGILYTPEGKKELPSAANNERFEETQRNHESNEVRPHL